MLKIILSYTVLCKYYRFVAYQHCLQLCNGAMILKHLLPLPSSETFWWERNSVSALHWVTPLCFPSQLWLQTTRRCKRSFHAQGQHFSPIHLICRLFAQAGFIAMFSSALPGTARRQQKAAGRLCARFVRDRFHSQQRMAGAPQRNRTCPFQTTAVWENLTIIVNLEKVYQHCPKKAVRSCGFLCQHHLGNSEALFFKGLRGPVLCLFALPDRPAFIVMLLTREGKQEVFSHVCCLCLSVEKGKSLGEEWEQLNYFMLRHSKTHFKNYCLMSIIYSQHQSQQS